MLAADITPGKQYGFRARTSDPLQRVTVIEKVRPGRWKVEFLDDPHPGLVDYVRSRQLACPWGDRKAVLREEKRMADLRAECDEDWPGFGPYDTAVMYVLEATGERVATERGVLSALPEVFERLWARIGEEPPRTSTTFVGTSGEMHCGWAPVEDLARKFAQAEPNVVADLVDMEERKLSSSGREPGEGWQLEYLRDLGPAFALIRQWVGVEEERRSQSAEINRLRQVIWMAVWELRHLGHDSVAVRIERALQEG